MTGPTPDRDVIREVRWTCDAVPVQAEGVLGDGRLFYFRARHGWVYLGVTESSDPRRAVLANDSDAHVRVEHPHAGWLGTEERERILLALVAELPPREASR